MGLQDYNSWEASVESTNPKDKIGKTKPPLHLIPPTALIEESMAMGVGAEKYGPFNWRGKTVSAMTYVGAALRHLMSFVDGENNDSESRASHLGHMRACGGIILDAMVNGMLVDDRPPKGRASDLIRQYTRPLHGGGAEYADVPASPTHYVYKKGPEEEFDLKGVADADHVQKWPPHHVPPMHERRCAAWPTELIDRRAEDLRHLLELGCKDEVACQITNGTTYSPSAADHSIVQRYVYVAGPMRGYPEFNFPAFDRARDLLVSKHRNVISPADIDRHAGLKEKEHPTGDCSKMDQRVFVYRDFFALFFIAHKQDGAIAMLPGWEKSTGAVAEFFLARWLGLKILDARTGNMQTIIRYDDLRNSVNRFLLDQIQGDTELPKENV